MLLVLTLPFSGPWFPICTKFNGQFSALSLLSLSTAGTADYSLFLETLSSFGPRDTLRPASLTPQAALLASSAGFSPMLECLGPPLLLLSPLTLLLTSFSSMALNTSQTHISTSYFCPELQTHTVNCLLEISTWICLKHNSICWTCTEYFT